MTGREKLIELLMQGEREAENEGFFNCHKSEKKAEYIADYLLKNGVTIPLVKMGDTVYQADNAGNIYGNEVTQVVYGTNGIAFDERAIGESVFLTREEAEKGLWIARYKV